GGDFGRHLPRRLGHVAAARSPLGAAGLSVTAPPQRADRAAQPAPAAAPAAPNPAMATRMLALATLAFLVCFAVWGLVAPLAPVFRERYHLSGVEVGLLVAMPVLLGSLGRIPLGLLTDRFGGRLTFTALLVAILVPLALAGLTDSYATLLGASLLLGIAGAAFAVGVPFVAGWFPPARQGMALGVYGAGSGGTAISSFFAPRLAETIGWRATFWLFLPLVAAMAVLFWLFGRDAPAPPRPSQTLGQRFAIMRRRPIGWVLALFYFVTFGGLVAMSVYLPTLLVDAYGLSRIDAGARTAGFVVLATLCRPIGGTLADRVPASAILNAVFLVVAALAIVLAFQPSFAVLTVAVLGIAAALGFGNGAVFKLVAERFPHETGTVTGVVGAAGGLGGFFPPLVVGAVFDVTDSYAIGFMLLSEFALGCLIVNVLALQRRAAALEP
ncbi:MAG TPA: MFS transporter, partial [Thermomicrobiales bacterium]|nr:MFS transporter [Thermomicrobiales bacterium]